MLADWRIESSQANGRTRSLLPLTSSSQRLSYKRSAGRRVKWPVSRRRRSEDPARRDGGGVRSCLREDLFMTLRWLHQLTDFSSRKAASRSRRRQRREAFRPALEQLEER